MTDTAANARSLAVATQDPNAGVNGAKAVAGQALFRVGTPLVFVLALLGLWELLVDLHDVRAVILPAPSVIAKRLVETWPFLMQHAVPTTLEAVGGFILAMLFGTALATTLVYTTWIRAAIYPTVVFFQLIPKIALAPLFIVWFGIGSESRLAFSLFISFFPIVIATMAGLTNVPNDMLRLCRSCTASEWQVFVSVRFPYAMPYIFSGAKIAVTFAMIGVIVGEFITAQAGLGYLIMFGQSQADTPLIMAALVTLCVIGLLMFGAVAIAERVMLRWFGQS